MNQATHPETASAATTCPVCGSAARYDFSSRDRMFDKYERYDYHACCRCGCVFQSPMPDPATIAGFYPSTYNIYQEEQRTQIDASAYKRALLRTRYGYGHLRGTPFDALLGGIAGAFVRLDVPRYIPGGRLLDVGCGNGRFLGNMQALGWQAEGVEFSADGVEVCRRAGLKVHHGDLASAAFADGSFDVVTVRHVIEHIPDPHAFIAELARILKPGGTLIVETPNADALGRGWFGPNWFANEVPRHVFLFSPAALDALGMQHGLARQGLRLETSPKIVLNSIDYATANQGRPSRKSRLRRLLARLYVRQAERSGRGDIIHASFMKPSEGPRAAATGAP